MLLPVYHKVPKRENNRRLPMQHPTEPMREGEYVTFQRKVDHQCLLTSLYFTVLKVHDKSGIFDGISDQRDSYDLNFVFYAVAGEQNEIVNETTGFLERESFTRIPGATVKRKYENQIAYIRCTHGWIHDLTVFDQSLNPGGPTENPQRCGIGTVLTELCLIDPAVHDLRGKGNLALEKLSEFPSEFHMAKRDCLNLVGLRMSANPQRAANVYFNAAINMMYGLLMVDNSEGNPQPLLGAEHDNAARPSDPIQNPIQIFKPIQNAKDNYDPITGNILPCEPCDVMCHAWGRRWFFCAGTF